MRNGRQPGFDEVAVRRALAGRRVLVTGHTGFKGGWLALWLRRLGAEVVGVALPPPVGPSLAGAIAIDRQVDSRIGDIRSRDSFAAALAGYDAELVFHMAAQALVRHSIADPVDTFATNVVGTATVLEAARHMPSLKAVVVVTSDKCYDNKEWDWGYRETDPMGGSDPYSASKGCTELVAASYRKTFFAHPGGPQLATVRAGNVIGGGDWSADRLVPDIVRAALKGVPVTIRNPASVRPWQHVLDALAGYLTVASRLVGGEAGEAWNFGPDTAGVADVATLAGAVADAWGPGGPRFVFGANGDQREARLLSLDSSKARARLGWAPTLDRAATIRFTIDWYRAWAAGQADMTAFTNAQIAAFVATGDQHDYELSAGKLKQCA